MPFRDPLVIRLASFLAEIGIEARPGTVAEGAILPGIDVEKGVLVIDEARLLYPGDILHEAGHLAVAPPDRRSGLDHNVGDDPAEEMMALAWSYAAALAIGIDPALVFHDHGYKGLGGDILENFQAGRFVGVPVLQWLGMAHDETQAKRLGRPAFPAMERWVRG
jgi:hypothetical protein